MKVNDLLKMEITVDVYDDYDGRCQVAFFGSAKLTKEGVKHFNCILNNEVRLVLNDRLFAVVNAENEEQAQLIAYLFEGLAGHCTVDEFERWFGN